MGLRARIWPGLRTRSIWFELVVALLSSTAVGLGMLAPEARVLSLGILLAGTALLCVLLFLFRRTFPLAPFLLSAVLAAFSPSLTIGVPISAYAMGRYVGNWPVRVVAAAVGMVAIAQPWAWSSVTLAIGSTASAALTILLPGAIGAYVRTRAELMVALRERAERAEAEREVLARDAVLLERARIAREMHDAVGHRVSLMVLQAGAIEMAAGDRERVEQLAGQVQTAGRQALEELRQAVGVLRNGEDDAAPLAPQPGLDDLGRLVGECRAAGMTVELRRPADAAPVDPAVSRAAYRIVQEALTNGGKHAPGAPVTVDVERPAGEVVVRVVNGPGRRPGEAPPGGGFGLIGLGERVRTLGGRLQAEPRLDGGFLVEAVLPAEAAVPA
jgi:signal transduction histidine kinase